MVAVVPLHPDSSAASAARRLFGRHPALDVLRAGGDRVTSRRRKRWAHRYTYTPKCVSSTTPGPPSADNFNLRSWTHDSELACAVLDSDDVFARDVRLRLLREHLDCAADGTGDGQLADPVAAVGQIISSAQALEAWHESGCQGPRPPGRLRPHEIERVDPLTRLWAKPAYRVIFDPDGRSYADRLLGRGP